MEALAVNTNQLEILKAALQDYMTDTDGNPVNDSDLTLDFLSLINKIDTLLKA